MRTHVSIFQPITNDPEFLKAYPNQRWQCSITIPGLGSDHHGRGATIEQAVQNAADAMLHYVRNTE